MMRTVPNRQSFISRVIAIDLIFLLFLVDQISKCLVLGIVQTHLALARDATATPPAPPIFDFLEWITATHLPRLDFVAIPVTPFLNIVMVWNQGISFGLMSENAGHGNILLMGLLGTIILGFGIWMMRTPRLATRLILAAIIGGALGNLWDRVRFGAVADFLDFHLFGWHYPAFNVADSLIVMGMIALIVYELIWIHPASHKE